MEAILSFGQPIVSAIVDRLIGQISSDAVEQFGRESGLQNDLDGLKGALARTRIILDLAERKRTNYRNLAKILEQLKDAVDDAEDLLDVFQYRALQQKAESQKDRGGPLSLTDLTVSSHGPNVRVSYQGSTGAYMRLLPSKHAHSV